MKKLVTFTSIILCTLLLCFSIAPQAVKAEGTDMLSVSIEVQYGQSDARNMLNMINAFRTSKDDAWAWSEDNQTKNTYQNLSNLQYDYELEKIAMLRAAEVALSHSHTRPDGTSCYTAYGSYSCNGKGENIAAGYSSAASVFDGWKEENEDYNGQGHRRNMLNASFSAIGIGHVYYNGTHYWVQEFSDTPSNTSESIANDHRETVSLEVLSSNISNMALTCSTPNIVMNIGENTKLPDVNLTADINGHFPSGSCPLIPTGNMEIGALTWTSANENVATVTADGNIHAVADGKTSVSAVWNELPVSCEVTVRRSSSSNPTDPSNPGTTNPGTTNPGTTNPGTTNPGTTNPGTTNPGNNSGSSTTTREYTIIFNSNSGYMRESDRQTTVNGRLTSLPAAFRDGYTFRGWYTQASGGNLVTTSMTFTADTTVYAQWDTFQSNFTSCSISNVTDTTALLIATIPYQNVRTWGVSFGTNQANLTTARTMDYYASTSMLTVTLTGLAPNTTYYYKAYYISDTGRIESGVASFTTKNPPEYTVTFYPNGGVVNGTSTMTTVSQKLPSLPTAYRDGYTFNGWYTEPYSGSQITTTTVIQSERTVYAHWTAAAQTPLPDTANPGSNSTVTNPGNLNNGNTYYPGADVSDPDSSGNTSTNPSDTVYNEPVSVKKVKIKNIKNSGKGKIKVKWSWYSSEDGYQIAYSTSKNFKSNKTSTKNAGIFTDSKTISGLKKGKTYYVRVRAYKKENGRKYYGSWSTVKKIKIKK